MEKENKVRIVCLNCLFSKVLPKLDVDPKGTRLITSSACEKCPKEGGDLEYFDINMNKLK